MEAKRKNVVLSAAFGYGAETVRVLLQSAKLAGVNAKFVIFSEDSSCSFLAQVRGYYPDTDVVRPHLPWLAKGLRNLNLWLKLNDLSAACLKAALPPRNPPSKAALLLAPYFLHAAISRYFFAFNYLATHHQAGHVLLADARDVFFQADPFAAVESVVVSGIESVRIKDEPFNSMWIYRAYDDVQLLKEIAEQAVVCSGVTIGPREEMRNYLGAFVNECIAKLDRLAWLHGFDQAIHNVLFRKSDVFRKRLVDNQDGWIMNLATASASDFVQDSCGVFTKAGAIPAILHQYDRHPALHEFLLRRIGASLCPSPAGTNP